MTGKLPRWAQRLLEQHPGAEQPTPENPLPAWLEEELRRAPLWLHIRGAADEPRWTHPFHLIDDVHRQPALLREVLAEQERINAVAAEIAGENYEHFVFIGCGSAYYTSLLGAFLFPRLTGKTAEGVEAWEFRHYWHPSPRKTLVIAQSATGGSLEVLEAVRHAKEAWGLPTLALTNTVDSPLESLADVTLAFPTGQKTGPDICVITVRLLVLYLLALAIGGATHFNTPLAEGLRSSLPTLPDQLARFLQEQEETVRQIAEEHHQQQCFFVVGGGPNWFTTLEAALKIEEESRTPCRAYQTGDFLHMAISLLAPERTTIVFAPPGAHYERLLTCLRTAQVGGSPTIAVIAENDDAARYHALRCISVPSADELLFPFFGTVIGQLFGYYMGVAKGVNPDTLGTDQLHLAKAWLIAFPLGSH